MNIGLQADLARDHSQQILGKAFDDFSQLKTFLDSVIITQLPEIWQGAGAEAYVQRYESLKPSFEAMGTLIQDIGEAIQKNVAFYEEADLAASRANAGM